MYEIFSTKLMLFPFGFFSFFNPIQKVINKIFLFLPFEIFTFNCKNKPKNNVCFIERLVF